MHIRTEALYNIHELQNYNLKQWNMSETTPNKYKMLGYNYRETSYTDVSDRSQELQLRQRNLCFQMAGSLNSKFHQNLLILH